MSNEIKKLYDKEMSEQKDFVRAGINYILSEKGSSPQAIKSSFSGYVQEIENACYKIYLKEQEKAGRSAIQQYLEKVLKKTTQKNAIIKEISGSFNEFDRFFLSLSQSRKSRAGHSFEDIIKYLFKKLDYPFDEQEVINGKPDFLFPGRSHYNSNPPDCIIFTVKRKLRERWRQIVTEGTRGLGFFLATIDKDKSKSELKEMLRHRIYMVVPSKILQETRTYVDAQNVISFETFFVDHLDPAVARWRKNKVI